MLFDIYLAQIRTDFRFLTIWILIDTRETHARFCTFVDLCHYGPRNRFSYLFGSWLRRFRNEMLSASNDHLERGRTCSGEEEIEI